MTIIELLIVVIIIGVLASVGLAKYREFSEDAKRKVCLHNLQTLEQGLAVWEVANNILAENVKVGFGFTTRTGRLTDTNPIPRLLEEGPEGAVGALPDPQPVIGGPTNFVNSLVSGPLNGILQDDKVWVCPSAMGKHYGGEIQYVPDDYMDTSGGGVKGNFRDRPIGLGGRYFGAVASLGNRHSISPITNGGFPPGWITGRAVPPEETVPPPAPQTPFRIFLCGNYGTFGPGSRSASVPGSTAVNMGGPVGPDGSPLSRHSSRW